MLLDPTAKPELLVPLDKMAALDPLVLLEPEVSPE